ncbi:hypothetical protein ACFWPX_33260 [Nocardia sp. NPDC058518]|uniref:hypothetical protein n=1 Tax=Nocardia sp. NPDC058518 TaxID=3346534 RepID=UPI0036475243
MTTETDQLALIVARCDQEGGYTLANLQELRVALGWGRLGKWVLGDIAEALEHNGLGYFPEDTLTPEGNPEPRQWHEVWLYRTNTPLARVVGMLKKPGSAAQVRATLASIHSEPDAGKVLTADQKLDRIRTILGH